MESQKYIMKQEKNDANNIVMRGVIYSFLPAFVLVYSGHSNVVVLIIILLMLKLAKNYYDIYVNYSPRYKTGNSYIKRKFKTIGLCFTIYFYVTFYLSYLIYRDNAFSSIIFYTITLVILFISYTPIINIVWYKFDRKRYKEIDSNNLNQKRYTTQ